jgi:hypothetical protein
MERSIHSKHVTADFSVHHCKEYHNKLFCFNLSTNSDLTRAQFGLKLAKNLLILSLTRLEQGALVPRSQRLSRAQVPRFQHASSISLPDRQVVQQQSFYYICRQNSCPNSIENITILHHLLFSNISSKILCQIVLP